jgi:hypothetical protein
MSGLWLVLALSVGFFAGFFLFALLAMARDQDSREPVGYAPLRAVPLHARTKGYAGQG